ncbi:MAG: hypothetical protein K6G72_09765 [Lachnospiraceae bacterium]|nr:hypothetical protein [Lachnospiraceae bacterium]
MRRMVGTKRIAAILMAAVLGVGLLGCGKNTGTSQTVSEEASVETSAVSEASAFEIETDPNCVIFKNILAEFGYTDSTEYSAQEGNVVYFDKETWDTFYFHKYENADEVKGASVTGKFYQNVFEILADQDFNQGIPCRLVTYMEGDHSGYEISFDNYRVVLTCTDIDKNFDICQKFMLDMCQTKIERASEAEEAKEEERPIRYEVEPEGTEKVFRLSSGTNVNNYNDSVFYIPAVPGLVAVDPYDDPAPMVGETKLCSPNRIYFKNQYGDWIMLVDYNRDVNGYNAKGEAFDYVRVGDTDIADMTLVDRINTEIGAFNAEVLIRDYEDENNADLKKEVTFILPAWKGVYSEKNRVENLSITYRCATVTEAFEFVDKYLANDIELEHARNNTEEYMHKLSPFTHDWTETYRNSPATIPHVETETVDWKEYVASLEPAEEQ